MIAWFARNDVASNLLMLTIVALGLFAVSERIPLEIFPEIERNVVNVSVTYRGATPAEVERSVAIRAEEAISDLTGIYRIFTDSQEGSMRMRVELLDGYDPRELLDDIKGRIDAISTFPTDIERPVYSVLQRRREVISVLLYGDLGEQELRRLSEEVRDDLTSLPDITQVELSGVRKYEISVEVPQQTLLKYGLTLDDVANAIRGSSKDIPAGSIRARGGEVLLRSIGQRYHGNDFKSIVVVNGSDGERVTLGDIAQIHDGFEEEPLYAMLDGKPSAELDVYRVGDQNAIDLANRVKQYIADKQADLPSGVNLAYWRDRSQYIKLRLHTLVTSAWQGGLLIFLLLTLFLRLSVAIWVCVGIPISFFGALALMPELGSTLNLVSLFAFILVLGIVVDDAIVTSENIYSKMKSGLSSEESAIQGTQEISVPVTFGVLTTVAAFLPLLFMKGDRGPLFSQIPLIVIPVLLFSLVESKLILPAHMKHVHVDPERKHNALQRFQRGIANGLESWIRKYYLPVLKWVLQSRYLAFAVFIALSMFIASFVASGRYGFTFFPRIQSEVARATLQMPRGTPLEITEKNLRLITEAAQTLRRKYIEPSTGQSIVRHVLTNVGQSSGSGSSGSTGESHVGRVSFEITPPEQRSLPVTSSEIVKEWRKMIGDIPGARELSFRAELGRTGDPIDIQLEGQDFDKLKVLAEKIKRKLGEYPGVFDIKDSFEGGKEEIKLSVKPEAELLGIDLDQLGQQVRHAFFGAEAQRIQRNRDDVRVMVRLPRSERKSVGNLESMYIRAPDGEEVPFSEVAKVETGRGFAVVNRVDRKRVIDITADINKQTANINQITEDINRFVPEMLKPYRGIHFRLEGEQREQRETNQSLLVGVVFVLFVIYSLLAIPFRSYVQPIIVMSVIPFGIIGAILGHMIMGMNLSIMSMMGMLALSGVVVNDSLMMVDYVNRRRRENIPLLEAVHAAGVARFRPILLTSLTTFAGLTPLILDKSTQAQFLIPMAVSLGFGVMFATVITLFLVPVGYLILEDIRQLPQRLRGHRGAHS